MDHCFSLSAMGEDVDVVVLDMVPMNAVVNV